MAGGGNLFLGDCSADSKQCERKLLVTDEMSSC